MTSPTVKRRRAELLINLAKTTPDPAESHRLIVLAAAELEQATEAEMKKPERRRAGSADSAPEA